MCGRAEGKQKEFKKVLLVEPVTDIPKSLFLGTSDFLRTRTALPTEKIDRNYIEFLIHAEGWRLYSFLYHSLVSVPIELNSKLLSQNLSCPDTVFQSGSRASVEAETFLRIRREIDQGGIQSANNT